tara:strand:- start:227 stop:1393 length:1167 start_codon:yes stop_codon:yes gene_type:complete
MILVVGLSTRMLVQSIYKSREVFALDVFGDRDLQGKVHGWENIGNVNHKIDEQKFLEVFNKVVNEFSPSAWIHTSGFEGKYNLITKAEKLLTHYGLSEDTIQKIRSPASFFRALRKLNINHPETIVDKLNVLPSSGWLRKNFDTAGGLGIFKNNVTESGANGVYFQKEIKGKPLSVFFLVEQENIVIFGFCENLYVEKFDLPYFYQGLVGPVRLSDEVINKIIIIVKKIVNEFHLIGLCGLDFILLDEDVFVIELNPRPTGAIEIFENLLNKSLLNMHCNAFINYKKKKLFQKKINFLGKISFSHKVIGTKIINADRNVLLSLDCLHKLESLSYCRDIPNIKNFKIGDPVCSVMVESSNITQVKSLLSNADSKVSDLITYNNKHLKLR